MVDEPLLKRYVPSWAHGWCWSFQVRTGWSPLTLPFNRIPVASVASVFLPILPRPVPRLCDVWASQSFGFEQRERSEPVSPSSTMQSSLTAANLTPLGVYQPLGRLMLGGERQGWGKARGERSCLERHVILGSLLHTSSIVGAYT